MKSKTGHSSRTAFLILIGFLTVFASSRADCINDDHGRRQHQLQQWVMEHVIAGDHWNPRYMQARLGGSIPVPVDDWNDSVIKGFYYPSADMTILADVLTHTVVTYEIGRGHREEFKILKDEAFYPYKRQVVVRLDRPKTESELRRIADKIRSKDSRQFERTFISYFLTNSGVAQMAWATSHYDPDLKIKILGPKAVDIQKALGDKAPNSRSLGPWISQMGIRKIVFRNEKLFLVSNFKDGSALSQSLVEKSSRFGRRFVIPDTSDSFTILSDGRLRESDANGVFAVDPLVK